MKKTQLAISLVLLCTSFRLNAENVHDNEGHAHSITGAAHVHPESTSGKISTPKVELHPDIGPNGGKIFRSTSPWFEFLVTKEKKVQVTFLDTKQQAVPAEEQNVTMICGDRMKPTSLVFTKQSNGSLLSNISLPEGHVVPVIITILPKAGMQAIRERLAVNLSHCGGCDRQEYVCTCGH